MYQQLNFGVLKRLPEYFISCTFKGQNFNCKIPDIVIIAGNLSYGGAILLLAVATT